MPVVTEDDEEGEEEGEEEEIDWEAIAADAPSRRTRGGLSARRWRHAARRCAHDARPARSRRITGRAARRRPRPCGRQHSKVIVIGAGYAGITAAKTLREFGYTVQVLEGRSRIGGRVHSLATPLGDGGRKSEKVTVELGAAVLMGDVHGGNPLARLCSRYGVATHKLDGHCPLHDVAEGGKLMDHDADTQAEKLFNELLERAHEERTAPAVEQEPTTGLDPATEAGTQVEAEYEGRWFSARVVERQDKPRGKADVLIHYDRWSRKFDEWLPLSSNRLRHLPISSQTLEEVLNRQLARSGVPLEKSAERAPTASRQHRVRPRRAAHSGKVQSPRAPNPLSPLFVCCRHRSSPSSRRLPIHHHIWPPPLSANLALTFSPLLPFSPPLSLSPSPLSPLPSPLSPPPPLLPINSPPLPLSSLASSRPRTGIKTTSTNTTATT